MQCLILALDRNGGHCILDSISTVRVEDFTIADEADRKVAARLLAEIVVGFNGDGVQMPEDWYLNFKTKLYGQIEATLEGPCSNGHEQRRNGCRMCLMKFGAKRLLQNPRTDNR